MHIASDKNIEGLAFLVVHVHKSAHASLYKACHQTMTSQSFVCVCVCTCTRAQMVQS